MYNRSPNYSVDPNIRQFFFVGKVWSTVFVICAKSYLKSVIFWKYFPSSFFLLICHLGQSQRGFSYSRTPARLVTNEWTHKKLVLPLCRREHTRYWKRLSAKILFVIVSLNIGEQREFWYKHVFNVLCVRGITEAKRLNFF